MSFMLVACVMAMQSLRRCGVSISIKAHLCIDTVAWQPFLFSQTTVEDDLLTLPRGKLLAAAAAAPGADRRQETQAGASPPRSAGLAC